MPSGTLTISKTRATPETFELMFVRNFNPSPPPLGRITIESLDELRSFLSSVGVIGADQDKAVTDVVRDRVALVRDVLLRDACIRQHGF